MDRLTQNKVRQLVSEKIHTHKNVEHSMLDTSSRAHNNTLTQIYSGQNEFSEDKMFSQNPLR